jgi:hypothetical protein
MKAKLNNAISILYPFIEKKEYEWKDMLLIFGFAAASIYLLVVVDMALYGYLVG